jgi:hypothetical protein
MKFRTILYAWLMPIAALSFSAAVAEELRLAAAEVDVAITFDAGELAREISLSAETQGFVRLIGQPPDSLTVTWPEGRDFFGEGWIFLAENEPITVTLSRGGEAVGKLEAALGFAFSPEPFRELDNTPATATRTGPGLVRSRLFPEGDLDVYAVSAPGDGVLNFNWLALGPHENARVRWLNAEGAVIRQDHAWETSISVEAGQNYYLELRSHEDKRRSVASNALVEGEIAFSPEPYDEPNGTIAEALPLEVGEVAEFRLMPRVDHDVFAVTSPGDGTFLAAIEDGGGHPDPRIRWLSAEGAELRTDHKWEPTIRVVAGETYYVEIRSDNDYWGEQGLEAPLRLRVTFSPEPYDEPNGTIAEALPLEVGEVAEFRLMPRVDHDVFAVTSPGDGTFLAAIEDGGGHPDPRVRWLSAEGAELRTDHKWEPTIRVVAGETYYVEIRSDNDYWGEQGLEAPLRLRVTFSPEPYDEPNDTLETAGVAEIGALLRFRLMPRVDRDYFWVTAPSGGTLILELLEAGGHPDPRASWYALDGANLNQNNWSQQVEGGQSVAFLIRSHNDFWAEQAREETLTVRVRLQRPDGSFVGEAGLPDEVALLPWEKLLLPPDATAPVIFFRPPQNGYYRFGGLGPDAVVAWTDLHSGAALEGAGQTLVAGGEYAVEILDLGNDGGAITLTIEIVAPSLDAPGGLYPRAPPLAGRALFAGGAP